MPRRSKGITVTSSGKMYVTFGKYPIVTSICLEMEVRNVMFSACSELGRIPNEPYEILLRVENGAITTTLTEKGGP